MVSNDVQLTLRSPSNRVRRYGKLTMAVAFALVAMLGCRRPQPGNTTNSNALPKPSASPTIETVKIDRRTFSLTLPAGWTEDTKVENYDADTFVVFEKASDRNCLFSVLIRPKSAGVSAEKLVTSAKNNSLLGIWQNKVDDFTEWGVYKGRGFDISGRLYGKADYRIRLFGFEQANSVYLLTESGPPVYFQSDRYFKTIRESFRVK